MSDKSTVIARCKELAKAETATGKIDWDEFGTVDPKWYAPAARLGLDGKMKSKYGTTVPLGIECKGQSDGTVIVTAMSRYGL
ncbi:hypothetical protein [Synechococcus sp. CBW1107]|uniref:hypothetical protein n=1 Tax=Synechococcus sp. CBW1107 TaxID=2789857 RepID=UPI002AD21A12|nr:hypothetical protein [Synechococcus sp. CBW1107]